MPCADPSMGLSIQGDAISAAGFSAGAAVASTPPSAIAMPSDGECPAVIVHR
jgi:hypothetical protein